jgi:hypothetical protein
MNVCVDTPLSDTETEYTPPGRPAGRVQAATLQAKRIELRSVFVTDVSIKSRGVELRERCEEKRW